MGVQLQIEGMEGGGGCGFSAAALDRAAGLVRDFCWLVHRHPVIRVYAVQIATDAIKESGRCGSRWLGEQVRRQLADSGVGFENGLIPLIARCAIHDEPELQGLVPTRHCAIDAVLVNAEGFGQILA